MRQHPNAHDRRCGEIGCRNKVHARNVCQHHYNRHYHRIKGGGPSMRHEGLVRVAAKGWGCIA